MIGHSPSPIHVCMSGRNDNPPHRRGRIVLDRYRAGHIFWMPAASTWLNVDKPRPFTLATACTREAAGTLVYGSTQLTERRYGAACIGVDPVRAGVNRNHLRHARTSIRVSCSSSGTTRSRRTPAFWAARWPRSGRRCVWHSGSDRVRALVHLRPLDREGAVSSCSVRTWLTTSAPLSR